MKYLSEHKSMEAAIRQMPELRLQLPNGTIYEHTGRVESISGVVDERTGAVSVCARFVMNSQLVTARYPWVVIPVERQEEYMAALEKASGEGDVEGFVMFVGRLM